MEIDVFYIATGVYKEYFTNFIRTIGNFFPKSYKRIHVISDGLDEYQYTSSQSENYLIEVIPTLDFPYPIIPLMKTYLISQYMEGYMKYIFYFDADTVFRKMPDEFWEDMRKSLDAGECIMSQHPGDFKKPPYEISPESTAYIDHDNYFYVISSFFAANSDTMKKVAELIGKLEKDDLQHHVDGHSEHYIPPLFDQDYFNKLVTDSRDVSFLIKRFILIAWLDKVESSDWFIEQKYNVQLKFGKKNM